MKLFLIILRMRDKTHFYSGLILSFNSEGFVSHDIY